MKRVRELAARYGVEAAPLEALLDALAAEPDPPTTVSDPVDEHLADSLRRGAVSWSPAPSGGHRVGCRLSGARRSRRRFPSSHVTLFESQRRHADVAERLRRRRGAPQRLTSSMTGSSPFRRASRFDVVTARAVASLAVLVEYAAPLLVGRRSARRVEGGARRRRGAGWGGGGPDRGPLARSRRARSSRSPARTPATCTSTSRPRPRPTASPAGPAWPASARSPEGGDGSVPNCYGMPPDSDRLRH